MWKTSLLKTLANKHKCTVKHHSEKAENGQWSRPHCRGREKDPPHQSLQAQKPEKTLVKRSTPGYATEHLYLDIKQIRGYQTAQQGTMRVL